MRFCNRSERMRCGSPRWTRRTRGFWRSSKTSIRMNNWSRSMSGELYFIRRRRESISSPCAASLCAKPRRRGRRQRRSRLDSSARIGARVGSLRAMSSATPFALASHLANTATNGTTAQESAEGYTATLKRALTNGWNWRRLGTTSSATTTFHTVNRPVSW